MDSHLDEDREFFLEVIDELVSQAASDESVAQATPEEKARWEHEAAASERVSS